MKTRLMIIGGALIASLFSLPAMAQPAPSQGMNPNMGQGMGPGMGQGMSQGMGALGGGFGAGKQTPQKKKSKSGNPAKRALEEGR